MHQVLHGRDAFLSILKLCRDPESGTTDELVVFNVYDAARNIAIDDVEGQIECLWSKAEGEVDLDEEVNETRSHMPSNLGLLIHGLSGTHGVLLERQEILAVVFEEEDEISNLHLMHVPLDLFSVFFF